MTTFIDAEPIRRMAFVVMRQEDERVAVLYSDSPHPNAVDVHARPWRVIAEPPHLATLADVDGAQYPTLKAAKQAVMDAFDPQTGEDA